MCVLVYVCMRANGVCVRVHVSLCVRACVLVCMCVYMHTICLYMYTLQVLLTWVGKERKFKIFKRGAKQSSVDTSTTSNGPTV